MNVFAMIIGIFGYIVMMISISILIAILDAKYWDYEIGNATCYVICGIFWPATLITFLFHYIIIKPFKLFVNFLVWITDIIDVKETEKNFEQCKCKQCKYLMYSQRRGYECWWTYNEIGSPNCDSFCEKK